ncbi:hypothetical protein DdX_06716 [Ditylenchus destructor]|uniref:Uncharacterized protein n=1 Tax=Ditylenchus destructor TaxID=166010 RepID=A0AAD4R978_9BILA|nr:hypothetical protein DdX_06716 [Ditylenchus destructor]
MCFRGHNSKSKQDKKNKKRGSIDKNVETNSYSELVNPKEHKTIGNARGSRSKRNRDIAFSVPKPKKKTTPALDDDTQFPRAVKLKGAVSKVTPGEAPSDPDYFKPPLFSSEQETDEILSEDEDGVPDETNWMYHTKEKIMPASSAKTSKKSRKQAKSSVKEDKTAPSKQASREAKQSQESPKASKELKASKEFGRTASKDHVGASRERR